MPPLPWIAGVALTYLCVLVASVVFRAETLSGAGSVLAGMAGWHGVGVPTAGVRGVVEMCWLAGLYAIVWLAPSTRWILEGAHPIWRPSPRWAVAMGCATTVGLLAAGGTGEFLYVRF
jgi:hypothetical protein